MINIIGHTYDASGGRLFIAWDLDGKPQPVFQPSMRELLDLLMDAEYICEYNLYNSDKCADVFFLVDGVRCYMTFEQWLENEVDDILCINLLNQYTHA